MKKITYLIGLVLGLVFSGCAGKSIIVQGEMKNHALHGADKIYKIASGNSFDTNYSGAVNVAKNQQRKFLIEADAFMTLVQGYKYFRIIEPIDTSAKMITSPEELKDTCFDKSFLTAYVDLGTQCSYEEGPFYFTNIIAVYKEKPSDVLTISAQEVIDYLAENDIYINADDFNIAEMKDEYLIGK